MQSSPTFSVSTVGGFRHRNVSTDPENLRRAELQRHKTDRGCRGRRQIYN
jgi:hypothetical protein